VMTGVGSAAVKVGSEARVGGGVIVTQAARVNTRAKCVKILIEASFMPSIV